MTESTHSQMKDEQAAGVTNNELTVLKTLRKAEYR